MSLTLDSLLKICGFDSAGKVKLVRHKDRQFDIGVIRRSGHFDFYQSVQRRPVFNDCERLVSFVGNDGTYATFAGVYDVRGIKTPKRIAVPASFPFLEMSVAGCSMYELTRDGRFAELEDRLVIDWGRGVKSWVQHFRPDKPKPVVELLPFGSAGHFPGFENVLLPYDELSRIVRHPLLHREWHLMLKSVAAVYLILDARTGHQYVGSAYGQDGLLGRWRTYVKNPDGGNVMLKKLLSKRPGAQSDFMFSILRTLPTTRTPKEVISSEYFYKQKLGSRAFGLNTN